MRSKEAVEKNDGPVESVETVTTELVKNGKIIY